MLRILNPAIAKSFRKPSRGLDDEMKLICETVFKGKPLEPVITKIVNGFGFDSFLYAMATSSQPDRDGKCHVWTTLPHEWVQAYEKNAYIEIDPRVNCCWDRNTPLVWDSANLRSTSNVCKFLDHAAQYGVRSGVVVSFRDTSGGRFGVMFNSNISPISAHRLAHTDAVSGALMVFSARFHDWFYANVVTHGAPPVHRGAPLSPRERQCLKMAAHGMTSADIGFKLGITERTVNFHFSNIISKLDVLNRKEAIGKALSQSIIETNY
jgi:DNA-binding CsgD family transcriptional regulator